MRVISPYCKVQLRSAAFIAIAIVHNPLWAQAVPRVSLGRPSARLQEEFSAISSLRELSDGRIVILDRTENRIVMANFADQSVRQLGRVGAGPGEYQRTTLLFPLPGDSTLMPGLASLRWLAIAPSGATSSLASTHPMVEFVRGGSTDGTDINGNILTTTSIVRKAGVGRDSAFLVMLSSTTGKVDTISRVDVGRAEPRLTLAEYEKRTVQVRHVHPSWDRYLLTQDGWVAIVRRDAYRVEWRSPDGKWTVGTPVVERPVTFSEREKVGYQEMAQAARRTPTSRGPGTGYGSAPPVKLEWPEVIPPFVGSSSVYASANGELLVQRTPTNDQREPVFDVFNRQGTRLYQLATSLTQKVIGLGKGAIYVVETNDIGIQHLGRYPWPPAR